jgi:hypothetical protein
MLDTTVLRVDRDSVIVAARPEQLIADVWVYQGAIGDPGHRPAIIPKLYGRYAHYGHPRTPPTLNVAGLRAGVVPQLQ